MERFKIVIPEKCKNTLFLWWFILVFGLFMLPGCASIFLPSTEVDKKLGAEVALEVEEQIGIYQEGKSQKYFQAIGQKLVNHLEDRRFDFSFQVVDQFEPNAFAVPGGHIYISRGLLVLANSEDELAGVIGHEISHVTERHSIRQMRKGILPGLLSLPGRIVGRVVSQDLGNLVNAPINTVGQVYLSKYSRGQEGEADRVGMRLAANSGYDPESLGLILKRIEKASEMMTGRERQYSFFDSHPMTPKRVENIKRDSSKIQWASEPVLAGDKEDFLNRLDGLTFGENPAKGIFQERKFLQPDLNFSIVFPSGWKRINTPMAVGAFAPNKEALAFMGVAGPAGDPEKIGRVFISKLKEEFKVQPSQAQNVQIGNWPGYVVTYTETSGGEPMHLHFLWVSGGELTFQLIGVGGEKFRESLKATALSLRPLSPEERNAIKVNRVRIVQAKPGETLAELSRRTKNVWKLPFTALVNNIPENKKLKSGDLIKIAREEPYHPRSQ